MALIIASSVQLVLENPLSDPKSPLARNLFFTDIAFSTIFILEAAIKIIAHGFILNGKKSYLLSTWNQIDFVIVLISIFSMSLQVELQIVKLIRLLRVLRPLRIISRNDGLKISIKALVMSVPNIINVAVISSLFFLIFGIIGVNYYKGSYYSCRQIRELPASVEHKWDCLDMGGNWLNNPTNFDRLSEAMMSMFTISSTVGWQVFMYQGIAVTKQDYEPIRNHSLERGLFYVFFIIVGNFFILNLFVGVVISNYNREKENLGKDFLLSKNQKKWLETKLMLIKTKPKLLQKPPESKLR